MNQVDVYESILVLTLRKGDKQGESIMREKDRIISDIYMHEEFIQKRLTHMQAITENYFNFKENDLKEWNSRLIRELQYVIEILARKFGWNVDDIIEM